MLALPQSDKPGSNYFDATDGKKAQDSEGFDKGENLYPCFAVCCLNYAQISYSCYPRYPDCIGCAAETTLCCVETSLMGCKPTPDRGDHYCVLIKTEQHCLSWAAMHSCLKARAQCFCIDLRAAAPKLGADEEVPCMLTMLGITCCFAGSPTCSCCLTNAQIKANSPPFFAARLQNAAIQNSEGFWMTASAQGVVNWIGDGVGTTDGERWTATITEADANKVCIKHMSTGKYLSNLPDGTWGVHADVVGEFESFYPSSNTMGEISLQGHKGFFSASAGATSSKESVEGPSERFTIWK